MSKCVEREVQTSVPNHNYSAFDQQVDMSQQEPGLWITYSPALMNESTTIKLHACFCDYNHFSVTLMKKSLHFHAH